jgi:S-adenosylmethionine hydrolase
VSLVTLLTDFGLKDPYVAVMKGVMLSINPRLSFVDITHLVEAQDVREACFIIDEYYRRFSPGTIHLCVVDPTVGSLRKALVVSKKGHLFVGPDNGLFSLLLGGDAIVHEISNPRFMGDSLSGTFHGRDVFAPAAAHLSLGIDPAEFGPPVARPEMLEALHPSEVDGMMTGTIVRFDRFGNAISNVSVDVFRDFVKRGAFRIEMDGLAFEALSESYYEGQYTCLVNSAGYLEFGLFRGDLQADKGIRKGERVTIRPTLP